MEVYNLAVLMIFLFNWVIFRFQPAGFLRDFFKASKLSRLKIGKKLRSSNIAGWKMEPD